MNGFVFVLIAAAIFVPQPSAAPRPSGGSGGGGGDAAPIVPNQRSFDNVDGNTNSPLREVPPTFHIEGVVRSLAGAPLSGVTVKMFSSGLVAGSATTDSDGSFQIEGTPDLKESTNTTLWFQSADPERYLDSSAVLSVGKVARERGLVPSCVPRIKVLGTSAQVEVTMMSADEWQKELEKSGCLSSS
jgi:hypothetical protein